MLKSRVIISSLATIIIMGSVSRSTPYVMSPLLWLLVVNNVIKLDREKIKTVAYADDVVVKVTGTNKTELILI